MIKRYSGTTRRGIQSSNPDIEHERMCDSPHTFSEGDESAYFSFSSLSCIGDDTGWSSGEDTLHCASLRREDTKEITAESLQTNYKYLKAEMEPLQVLDCLYSFDSLDDAFSEECRETKGRRRRNDLLIKKIYCIAETKTPSVLQHFANALHGTDQKHIVKNLIRQTEPTADPWTLDFAKHFGSIKEMRHRKAEDIEPRAFIDDLLVWKVISFYDHEDITRLDFRKDRVDFIFKKADENESNAKKTICAIGKAYPLIFDEYKRRTEQTPVQDEWCRLGTTVNIRMHLKTGNLLIGRKGKREHLRQIEKMTVEKFNDNPPQRNEIMDDLVEECRCKFEGLKISSIAIHLLTEAGDSLEKVLDKIRSGQAVDWLLSILDDTDKRYLKKHGTTKLLVRVEVNGKRPIEGCLCLLDKSNISQKRERLAKLLTSDDVDELMQQMKTHGIKLSGFKLVKSAPAWKRSLQFLDFLIKERIPHICFCLLEETIRSKDPILHSSFFTGVLYEDILLSKTHVKQHEQFLIEELEVRTYLPLIRTMNNEKSIRLLEALDGIQCRDVYAKEFLKFLLCEEDLKWFWDEVKKKQKYIWDTVTSSKRNITQSKKDLVAVQLMTDKIIDEIDPSQLKCYMDADTVKKLGFAEFQNIPSRRVQIQSLLNRLSTDTVGSFMDALHQSGYDYIESKIREGSLAKEYVCPRIHHGNSKSEAKYVFEGQFEINTKLKRKVLTATTELNTSPSTPASSKLYKRNRPISTGSAIDSESGIYSDFEGQSSEYSDICDLDEEGFGVNYHKPYVRLETENLADKEKSPVLKDASSQKDTSAEMSLSEKRTISYPENIQPFSSDNDGTHFILYHL